MNVIYEILDINDHVCIDLSCVHLVYEDLDLVHEDQSNLCGSGQYKI